jgi:hypothetical protein
MYVAVRILNARTVKATGVSPQELVFAGRLDLDRSILFPRQVHESTSISEYMRVSMDMQEEMLQIASAQQQASDEAHLDDPDGSLPTVFAVGSYVLVRYETDDGRPIDKLAPVLRGPYLVTHREPRLQGDVYTCQDLTTKKSYDFRVNLLRPFHYDKEQVNPADISLLDHEAFIIESVLDHRFGPGPATAANLQLLVKWQGFQEPTWQRFDTATRKVQAVHTYLIAKRLKKFIPRVRI